MTDARTHHRRAFVSSMFHHIRHGHRAALDYVGTTPTSNGTHVLSARTRDTACNLGTSSDVSVTVPNTASGPKAFSQPGQRE